MSFARHNRGRPLFSQTDLVSARERALLAENRQLRTRNKRLKDAMLTLVERVETQLPYLEEQRVPLFEQSRSTGREWQQSREKAGYRKRSHYQDYSPPPKMEIYETYHEPIEFGEPAPAMHFDNENTRKPERWAAEAPRKSKADAKDFRISPELAPEEIDILKSPTRDRPQQPRRRKTMDIVDLHPSMHPGHDTTERYEAGDADSFDIPDFEFPEEEPILDIDFERKETLRAAMRRRVNRLRW